MFLIAEIQYERDALYNCHRVRFIDPLRTRNNARGPGPYIYSYVLKKVSSSEGRRMSNRVKKQVGIETQDAEDSVVFACFDRSR